MTFPCGSAIKKPPALQEIQELWVPSLTGEDPPGGGHGNPLQYTCLENPVDRGAWWATVHRLAESDMTEATEQALMERPTTDDRLIEWVANSFCLSHVNLCWRDREPNRVQRHFFKNQKVVGTSWKYQDPYCVFTIISPQSHPFTTCLSRKQICQRSD